jgi:hypothetical protein
MTTKVRPNQLNGSEHQRLAVFAVLPENLQRAASPLPQKSSAAGNLASGITARPFAVFRCSCGKNSENAKGMADNVNQRCLGRYEEKRNLSIS